MDQSSINKLIISEILLNNGYLGPGFEFPNKTRNEIIKELIQEFYLQPLDPSFDEDGNFIFSQVEVTEKALIEFGFLVY